MNCKLVASLHSQFFHSRQHFSSQANERSTTQRLSMTANFAILTAWPPPPMR